MKRPSRHVKIKYNIFINQIGNTNTVLTVEIYVTTQYYGLTKKYNKSFLIMAYKLSSLRFLSEFVICMGSLLPRVCHEF